MISNARLTDEYISCINNAPTSAQDIQDARRFMESSTAIYHGTVVDSTFVPRLYNTQSRECFTYTSQTAYTILTKVIKEYLNNPAYREIFDFDERLVDLILLPRNYDALLPFARVDVFYDEETGDITFCEFNADGSSGMNENREITQSIMNSAAFKDFQTKHTVENCIDSLFSGWVDEFLRIYDTYTYKTDSPHIAIVDFLENAITEEFKIFAHLFAERGIECSVYDVRDLTFDGDKLIGTKAFYGKNNAAIDAIWRRSVTNDIIDNWDASQPLIEAVRAQKVALIGSFAGHIVHDKQIFEALYHPLTQALLTDEENAFVEATVPFTTFLDDEHIDIERIKNNPNDWIIKPTDAYGSKDVYAGRDFDQKIWARIVDTYANNAAGAPFLVQRYCVPFTTKTLALYGEESDTDLDFPLYNNLSGLYLYNGTFTGVFSRLGPKPVICKRTRGVTAATLWVDC